MGVVVGMKGYTGLKKIWHKLFKCPTYWKPDKWYKCPRCKKVLKCIQV